MADFNNPTLTSLYTDMLDGLKSRDVSALQWLDGSTDTNIPSGAKRWNAQNNYFEKFNGTAWGALSTRYMIDVDKLDGCTVNDLGTSITDIWTANKTTTALSTKLDSVTYTASDILAKIKTVGGATSGLDADLLDGMHATNSNTVYSVVSRDASGNFSAGTITATLSGNAASATTAASCSGNASSATYATTQGVGTSNTTIATTAFVYANSVNTLTDLGVTSTAAALNFVAGVTSNIQSQLNSKLDINGTAANANKLIGMNWNWAGQAGQPAWLWGGSDGANMYVYNPVNFSVNYANSAGVANSVSADVVGAATAGLGVGAVGTYAFLGFSGSASPGVVIAGSSLLYADQDTRSATSASGSWRVMGIINSIGQTVCLRIA